MKPRPPHPRAARQTGFTLIELIVTLSILLVMLGLINFIFRDTQKAVSLGIETGETIGSQRGIASQIRRDFDAMLGPHQGGNPESTAGGGFLVITQKLIGDSNNNGRLDNRVDPQAAPDPNLDPITDDTGLEIELPTNNAAINAGSNIERRLVRSDQIGFIRERGSDQPVAPIVGTEFTSRRVPGDRIVDHARVWYGHALRTDGDGIDPAVPVLGAPGSGNENPLDWLLARQSVFLDATLVDPGAPDDLTANVPVPDGIFAEGLEPGAVVERHIDLPAATVLPRVMSSGLADYAFVGLEFDATARDNTQSLVGDTNDPTNPAPTDGRVRLLAPDDLGEEIEYETAAVNNGTYVLRRLRANPIPPATYRTWEIAQNHPVVTEGCSDFVVEFAADMYGGGPARQNVARVEPGDFEPDGQIDLDPLGNIAWYSIEVFADPGLRPRQGVRLFPPADGYPPLAFVDDMGNPMAPTPPLMMPNLDATAAFVWRHDRFDPGVFNTADGNWVPLTSNGNPADFDPDESAQPFCDWPYLIRVRYRLHDPKGQIASGAPLFNDDGGGTPANANNGVQDAGEEILDSRNGIWFEQVVQVNRPLPQRVNTP